MRINGAWLPGADGVIRPTVQGAVRLANGKWLEVSFLLDAGADRTVFSSDFLSFLQPLEVIGTQEIVLGGVGGAADSITIETSIGFVREDDQMITVRGVFGVFTKGESADLSILGRDITNNFSVIYDYPQQVIALLGPPHAYGIERS